MEQSKHKRLLDKYKSLPKPVRASFWFLICSFLQKGISSITTPIFTRLLTTAEYGQFSVFNSWMSILTVFVSMNLYSGVYTQGLIKFDKERREYSSSLQGLSLTLALAWTVIYFLFRNFWNGILSLTTVQMLSMLILIWLTSVFNFWAVEKRVELSYQKLIVVTLIASFARPIFGIILVINSEDKVTARILGMVLVDIIAYAGLFFVQMKRGKKFYSAKFWKYALTFNLPLIPHYLSMSVLSGSDRIMISNMVGNGEAGIYNLAYSISQIMALFNTALMQTVEPWLYQKIKDKQIKNMSKVAYSTFILIAGVNIMLIAFAPEVVAVFAPQEYYEAIWVIPPVAMSVYFIFSYNFFAVFEFYYEKTKYVMAATSASAVMNIVLNYIFIRICGYQAAGYTTLACYILYAMFHYCFMRKICRERLDDQQPYSLKALLLITGMFMIMGFAFLCTYKFVFIRYVLIAVFLCVIFIKHREIVAALKGILDTKSAKKRNLD